MNRRPIRKWIVRSLLVSFLLFLLFLGKLYWDWRSTRRAGEEHLARVMKELDESEPGWRDVFDVRNRRLAPPERNSAEKALVVLKSLPMELHNWSELFKPTDGVEPNQLLPDDRIVELKENLAPHGAAVEKLKELIGTEPNSGFAFILREPDILDTPIENRFQMYRGVRLMSFQCEIVLAENQQEQTIRLCRAMIGAGRALGDDPNFIAQLKRLGQVDLAIQTMERILGTCEPKTLLTDLQHEMLAECFTPFIQNALVGERVFLDRLIENMDNYSLFLPMTGGRPLGTFEEIQWKVNMQYAPEQRAYALEMMTHVLADSKSSWPERSERIVNRLEQFHKLNQKRYAILKMMMPALQKVDLTEQRVITQLRCAVVALACERFRQANGRWPNELAEIPKSILTEIPNDSFTGEPLMMTRTELGLHIYSTGKDGVDDGGEVLDPKMEPGTDIGFRLYDPAHRRKPAPVQVQVVDEEFPKP